jgi:hypothetical protein
VVGWVALEWSSGVFERVVAEGVFLFLDANLFVVASQDGGFSRCGRLVAVRTSRDVELACAC